MGANSPKRTVSFVLGLSVAFGLASPPLAAANLADGMSLSSIDEDPSIYSKNNDPEFKATILDAQAKAAGALGVYWTPSTETLTIVYPSGADQRLTTEMAAVGLKLAVASASAHPSDLEDAKDAVRALVESGRLKGESTSVGLDLRRGVVVIRSTADPAVFAGFRAGREGRVPFERATGQMKLMSRLNDSQPYWGGGRLRESTTAALPACSSGFTVRRNLVPYMVTAGHCWPNIGRPIYDGAGQAFGNLAFRAPFPDKDVEFIGGKSYGGRIFLGNLDPIAYGDVESAANPVVGFVGYRSSGSFSWEKGLNETTRVDIMSCDPDNQCFNHLVEFFSGSPWVEGDSGGPIFRKWTGSPPVIGIRGLITGIWDDLSYGTIWSAVASSWGGVSICETSTC